MFWSVVGASAAASVTLFAAIYSYWRYFPHTRHQRRVSDLKALRDLLLYHVDDLEDILEALQKRPELTAGEPLPMREHLLKVSLPDKQGQDLSLRHVHISAWEAP